MMLQKSKRSSRWMRRCQLAGVMLMAFVLLFSLRHAFAVESTKTTPKSIESKKITFNKHIRPILSENCFHCHGPDEEKRGGGLRLDVRDDAIDSGAIEPGDVGASYMIDKILDEDPDSVMPPPSSHKTLTAQQKQLLVDWVTQGAVYEKHWSLEPIVQQADPEKDIDSFVDQGLIEHDLQPSAPASRERWLRRVTLDLTGLPPTVDEINRFLSDRSEDAFGRVVDRLLASEAYGERMTSEWLDVARYSDTYGYQVDRDRFVWPWRDWVIKAFNHNMPYDQFITEQLAGDLLKDATKEQILATTFNRLHPQKVEGGSVEEEFRVEYVVDRAQTVSTAFMGLTFECSRCHDHKFDPLSQKEFYQLNAFFANINESGLYSYHTASIPTPTLRLPSEKQQADLDAANAAVTNAQQELQQAIAAAQWSEAAKTQLMSIEQPATDGKAASETLARWGKPVAMADFDQPAKNKKDKTELVEGVQGKAAKLSGDRGVKVGPSEQRRWQPFSVALWMQTPDVKERAVVFHRSRGWTDAASRGYQLLIEEGKLSAALVHYWPGNAICVRTKDVIPTEEWLHVAVTYDGSSRAGGLRMFINGKLADCEIIEDELTKDISAGNVKSLMIGERERDRGFTEGLVDNVELYDRQLTTAEVRFRHQLKMPHELLTAESLDRLGAEEAKELWVRYANQTCQDARTKLLAAREKRDRLLDQIQEIMVMRELSKPRETHILERGEYDKRRELVSPGTPAALPPFPEDAPRNRLGLAQWLTSPDHPLTARVAVNRYWQMVFGRGLVVTTEDFGSQGALPTHPELLDWLSRRFIDSGWDVKKLLKTMVLSAAYRRDSAAVGDSDAVDPDNMWLSRGPTAPLTAEMIRDAALASGGLISRRVGGAPVRPYELSVSFKPVKPDKGEGLYRRSLYTYWKRTSPAPVMLVLDASTRDVCRVRRERTSSPLQAMVLLNGPQYVEAARGAAVETLQATSGQASVSDQLQRLFLQLTSRKLQPRELAVLEGLYEKQLAAFTANPESVKKYLSVGEAKPPETLDTAKLAAMSVVAQAVMNLDDCLIKR